MAAVRVRSRTFVPAGVESFHDSVCHVEPAPASKAEERNVPLELNTMGTDIVTLSTLIDPGGYVSNEMPLPASGLGVRVVDQLLFVD